MAANDDQMVAFECSCGRKLRAHSRLAGKRSRCPSCRRVVQIPGGPTDLQPITPATDDPLVGDLFDTSDDPSLPLSPGDASAGTQQPLPPLQHRPPPPVDPPAQGPVSVGEQHRGSRQMQAAGRFPIVELICGGLMLVTFLLPWWTGKDLAGVRATFMSWDLLNGAAASVVFLMVSMWFIGVAAIVTACFFRGLPAAFAHGGMGVGGALLLCIISAIWSSDAGAASGLGAAAVILGMISLMIVMVQIVATNVRLKCEAGTMVRVFQAMASGLVIILTTVGLVMMLVDIGGDRSEMWPDILFRCIFAAAMIAAMALILVHAVAMKKRTKALGRTGLYLIYAVLSAMAAFLVIRSAVAMAETSAVLLFTNALFLFAPSLALMCLGATKAICLYLGPVEQGQ